MTTTITSNDFQRRADALYDSLIQLESSADQEQLFLCSYLLGHISLISAENGDSTAQFDQLLQLSLDTALEIDQLSEQDKLDITELWQQLRSQ
ncbi:YfcL family protein [Amphritea sp. HPY]|uniref:YfcL family protein n=1 Tax=Amphritea sp. HPY TaxID=3421652 RepID=UPI003D7C8021